MVANRRSAIACKSGTCPQGLICASNQPTLDSAGNVVSRVLCVGKLPPE